MDAVALPRLRIRVRRPRKPPPERVYRLAMLAVTASALARSAVFFAQGAVLLGALGMGLNGACFVFWWHSRKPRVDRGQWALLGVIAISQWLAWMS